MEDKILKEHRNSMLTLWNVRTRESADVSAYLIYGKFLNFIEAQDFAGSKLAKQFLRLGKVSCRAWGSNSFKKYYSLASNNDGYVNLKKNFFRLCKK